jgi:(S)-mandelate dehydrogenase
MAWQVRSENPPAPVHTAKRSPQPIAESGAPISRPAAPGVGGARALPGITALAALGLLAGGWALARRGGGSGRQAVARPVDQTLAGASPAVLGTSPRRRLYAGSDLDRAVTIEDLRAMAHRYLPQFATEYLEGGAEDEATLAGNLAAFGEWRFMHRSLVDVSRRDVSSVLFERRMAMPLAIAPTGLNGLYRPHADLQLAQAAARAGIPFTQSTMSNDGMEAVARVPGLRYWWQLYVFGPSDIRRALIARAREAGCEALIVTIDAQAYGNREWEKRTQSGPKALAWSAKLDALRHPGWLAGGMLSHGTPRFENVIDYVPKGRQRFFDSAAWIRSQMDMRLSWDTIARIREQWPRRLIIKGLLDVADVVRAAKAGVDAVVLSNHGGRQLDWAVSPLDVLPAARQAVGDSITLIVDGGIRRGSDVVKAIALGADAVLAGRAPLYGVAAGGRRGVERALAILKEEIDRNLALLGVTSIAQLTPDLLVPAATPQGRSASAGD